MKHGKLMPGGGHLKMPGGGRLYDYMKQGGKLKMVRNDEGDLVPFYAADGKGKMEYGGKTMGHGGMNDGEPMLVIKLGKDGIKYMDEGGKNNGDEGFGENDPYEGRAEGTRDNKLINDDDTAFNSGIEGFNPTTLGDFSERLFVRNIQGEERYKVAVKLDDGTLRPVSDEEFDFMNKQFMSNDYGNTVEAGAPEAVKRSISFYLPEFQVKYDDFGNIKSYENVGNLGSEDGPAFNSRFDRELEQYYDTEALDVRAAAMATDKEKERLGLVSGGSALADEEKIREKLASTLITPLKRSQAHVLGSNFAAKTFFGTVGDSQGVGAVENVSTKIRSQIGGVGEEQKEEIETSGAGMDASGMQRVKSPDFSTPVPSSLTEGTASTMNFGGRVFAEGGKKRKIYDTPPEGYSKVETKGTPSTNFDTYSNDEGDIILVRKKTGKVEMEEKAMERPSLNFGGRLRMANQGAKMAEQARRTVFRFPRS
jgi:hypothetical protein